MDLKWRACFQLISKRVGKDGGLVRAGPVLNTSCSWHNGWHNPHSCPRPCPGGHSSGHMGLPFPECPLSSLCSLCQPLDLSQQQPTRVSNKYTRNLLIGTKIRRKSSLVNSSGCILLFLNYLTVRTVPLPGLTWESTVLKALSAPF